MAKLTKSQRTSLYDGQRFFVDWRTLVSREGFRVLDSEGNDRSADFLRELQSALDSLHEVEK